MESFPPPGGKTDIIWRSAATGENYVWYIEGAAQIGGAPVGTVGDLAWDIVPQVYPAAGCWKAGDLYDVDAVVGNHRYVPSTVEAGARLPRGLAGGFVQGSPADEPCSYDETQFTHSVYCDWGASGYRLPSEGEWEYFCRAGTTTPFWIAEPGYTSANCGSTSASGM